MTGEPEYPARQALLDAIGPMPLAARAVILALTAITSDEMLSALAEAATAINCQPAAQIHPRGPHAVEAGPTGQTNPSCCADADDMAAPATITAAPAVGARPNACPDGKAAKDGKAGNHSIGRSDGRKLSKAEFLARDRKIVAMKRAGMSWGTIQNQLGVATATISRALKNPLAQPGNHGGPE